MSNEALRPLLEALQRCQREAGALMGNTEGLWIIASVEDDAAPLMSSDDGRVALHGASIYLAGSEATAFRLAEGFNAKLIANKSCLRMRAEPARLWVGRRIAYLLKAEALLLSQVRSPA